MDDLIKDIDYDILKQQGTGSIQLDREFKIINYPFDKYIIKIKLSLKNEFIGIEEIKINKSFISYTHKTTPKGFHDVTKLYLDQEDE